VRFKRWFNDGCMEPYLKHRTPLALLEASDAMATKALGLLFASPEVNPINRKAKSIPVLNPFDPYGRVFLFSWLGFMVAFLSWYAFPPLVSFSKIYPGGQI
jgi:hypothetical protein